MTPQKRLKPVVSNTLRIHFGAFAYPIRTQLKQQGFKFKLKDVMNFEKQVDAITRLKFAGLITDIVANKICDKLYNNIKRHVRIEN